VTEPIIERIGPWVIEHGERDDSEMCLCGHNPYYTCPKWAMPDEATFGALTLDPSEFKEARRD